jgi:uncharacterized protein YodC (DUF2158 family)
MSRHPVLCLRDGKIEQNKSALRAEIMFKTGDIVQLKSGGPEMTVKGPLGTSGDSSKILICQWFGGKKLEQGHFLPDSLKAVTAKPE